MFMLNTSQLEQHELRMLSGMARHVSLQTECAKYSEELSAFLKDKDNLLIDLVKALKRITNEWRSWNHKLFGGLRPNAYVASVDQIVELLEWTERTYPSSMNEEANVKNHWQFCVETLRRYIAIHAQMQRFYSKFVQSIYSPLAVYYKTKHCRKTIIGLSDILNNWGALLQTGIMIKESCFTKESIQFFMEVIFYSGCRDFYLVLRLIPDLCMKAAKCVRMVQSLLDSTRSNGFEREQSYIFEVWRPVESFDAQTREEKKLHELTAEKQSTMGDARQHDARLKTVTVSLEDTRRKLRRVLSRMDELNEKKMQTCSMLAELSKQLIMHKEQAKEIKLRINSSRRQHSSRQSNVFVTEKRKKRWVSAVLSDMLTKDAISLPSIRALSSTDIVEQLTLEHKSICLDIERITKHMASNSNHLKNIEADLDGVMQERSALMQTEKILDEEEKMLRSESSSIEVKDRVLTGYIKRIEKNIKKAAARLPPVNL
eukprot:gene18985-20892_t